MKYIREKNGFRDADGGEDTVTSSQLLEAQLQEVQHQLEQLQADNQSLERAMPNDAISLTTVAVRIPPSSF